jgi:thioesterase domain-containing protein/acyl carrier protein
MEAGWENTPGLKMLCGGEALPRELASGMLERSGELWNMYGPTETTIWSSVRRIEPASGPVLIGPPIANTQFFIVDNQLEPVPIGVAGELLIGGDGLSRGYLNRPDLTAERFIERPFPGSSGRLYRTGDLARFRSDGAVEFLGRLDFQVKVRGYRIELGEIEHVLTQHAGVKDAVAMTWEEDGDKRLVAYYVPEADNEPTADDLRKILQEKLPQYMIPSAFVRMETFPLTANGKLDRKALPPPHERFIAVTREFVAPRDPLEQALAGMWSKILKVKRVGLHDNFFDLGGHSLAAVRLVSEVEKLTGKSLPLATLFQASTVAALADILRTDGWAPSWSSLVPIQPRGSRSPLFLVHAAHGNVLLYRQVASYVGPDQPVYGLQSQGLSGDGRFNSTIEEMASHYVKEIISVEPDGPYFIGGYCLGGIIALEIAQQLTRLGKRVEAVILLDTYNLSVVSLSGAFLRAPVHLLQNVWFHCANSFSIRGKDRTRFLREKVDIALTRLGIGLRAMGDAFRRPRSAKTHHSGSLVALKRINDEAAFRYVPRPYSGRVALIRSRGYFSGLTSPSYGWSDLVRGNLEIHELPVYPRGMLIEPYCGLLADTIKMCLSISGVASAGPLDAGIRWATARDVEDKPVLQAPLQTEGSYHSRSAVSNS